ncbi:ABC-2 transporter permease, partial [Paenibacillus glucanolyticus]
VRLAVPQLNKPDNSIAAILVSMGIVLVLISIYMPLFYALNKKGAGIINAVFMIALIVLAQPAAFLMQQISVKGGIGGRALLLIPVGLILLCIGSYYLTVYLFNRKDI